MDNDRANFAREWRTAQAISLTIPNLITAAKRELSFLARVNQDQGLRQAGPTLDRAVRRYKRCWLPLLASQEGGASALVPPLDCAWVWHCHRLNPIQYAQDCKTVHGKILGAPVPEARYMVAATETTIQLWKEHFPTEPYHHIGLSYSVTELEEPVDVGSSSRRITYDLVDSVLRQSSFYYQVSHLHFRNESFLHAAEMRYKGFLHLAAKSKGKLFLVPTYDIDLMWHSHQLDPLSYRADMLCILGKVMDHDDTDTERHDGSKLSNCFHETKQLWEETYSIPYEKAGAMYRGEAPTPLQHSSSRKPVIKRERFTSHVYRTEQEAQYGYLAGRELVQVHFNILGAKNVPVKQAGGRLFIRLRALKNCGSFEISTPEVELSEQPRFMHGASWTFSFETSVEGIILELRVRKPSRLSGGFKKKSKLLGEVHVPFNMLLASPTLSALDWLSLHKEDQIWDLQKKPPALEISASITPSVTSPYLLRAITARTTDDSFQDFTDRYRHVQMGRWLTRTVLDHKGNDVYTIRIRKLKGCKRIGCIPVAENERIVDIYRPNVNAKPQDPPITLAASAIQLMDSKEQLEKAKLQRQWALFEPNTILTVRKNRDPKLDEYPELTLEGSVGYPVALISGRWMQYQVRNSPAEEERGFVTLVRYTPECPTGKATALYNWKSGALEVTPGENAVLVLLLSTVTALAVHDLLGRMSQRPTKMTKKIMLSNKAEWGAVNIERGSGGRLAHRFWWTLSSQLWSQEIYDVTPKTAAECGGAGACGGGACAAGGSCGGGCLASG